ncbi:MAG: BMC domain-containing protein [Calditrichaeota bacterium]|nr:BMC domain-containing protein [Calditrichota bacterium]
MKGGSSALGIIETRSYAAAIEAADAMVKAARVDISGLVPTGGGFITVVVRGDVASVKAAVEAAGQSAEKVGPLVAAHVIPRPHEDVEAALSRGQLSLTRSAEE